MLRDNGRIRRLASLFDVGSTMSEPEKKGSAWPWILVPVAAVSLFFSLRACQHRLPADGTAVGPPVTVPAAPGMPAPPAPEPEPAMPDVEPAPQ